MQQHQGGSISMCLPPWQPNRFPGGHKSDSDLFRAVSNQVLPSNHCAHRVLRQNVSSINYLKAYLYRYTQWGIYCIVQSRPGSCSVGKDWDYLEAVYPLLSPPPLHCLERLRNIRQWWTLLTEPMQWGQDYPLLMRVVFKHCHRLNVTSHHSTSMSRLSENEQ